MKKVPLSSPMMKTKKKYYAFNKGTKEKVGELIDQKVKLLAKVKKKVGAKISLMTYIISIKPVQ